MVSRRSLSKEGWTYFSLDLCRKRRGPGAVIVEGIYSQGGKHGIAAWMDVAYFPVRGKIAHGTDMDLVVFRSLSRAIPPGGHIMVSYETHAPLQEKTMELLAEGMPPALTPLGSLLFLSGFIIVKDWYLSEGGHEGPRKLWAEKPPDKDWEERWMMRARSETEKFLGRGGRRTLAALAPPWRRRAAEVIARAMGTHRDRRKRT